MIRDDSVVTVIIHSKESLRHYWDLGLKLLAGFFFIIKVHYSQWTGDETIFEVNTMSCILPECVGVRQTRVHVA